MRSPRTMAGVNQMVVMMNLSIVASAAVIGAGGRGFIVVDPLGRSEVGRGTWQASRSRSSR